MFTLSKHFKIQFLKNNNNKPRNTKQNKSACRNVFIALNKSFDYSVPRKAIWFGH